MSLPPFSFEQMQYPVTYSGRSQTRSHRVVRVVVVTAWQQSGCFDGVTCDCCNLHHLESPLISHPPWRLPLLNTQTTLTFSRGPSSSPCAQNHISTPISEPARPLGFHRHNAPTTLTSTFAPCSLATSPTPRPLHHTYMSAHAASHLISDSDTRNDVGHGTTPVRVTVDGTPTRSLARCRHSLFRVGGSGGHMVLGFKPHCRDAAAATEGADSIPSSRSPSTSTAPV